MNPGPAISTELHAPSRTPVSTIVLGDLARVAAERFGESEDAVHLGVGAIGRPDDGIDATAPGHLGERRGEQRCDGDERVGHGRHSGATTIDPTAPFISGQYISGAWTDSSDGMTSPRLSRASRNAATASSDGTPHVSVVAAVVDGDVIWIATNRSSGKALNLAANPRIALVFRPGSESYVSGTVEIVDDVDEKRRRWSGFFPYDAAAFFGPPENDGVVLLKVRPTSATVMTQDATGLHRRRWHA